jgi:hypothetical protein
MRLRHAPRRQLIKRPPFYHDGIHLDFAYGTGTLGHYVKAPGSAPTIAAFTSLFTFTGGNQSYYMGPAGLLVPSATNTPRIEYDASGNCLGLLMEAARTNLGLYSNDATNAAWAKTNMTADKTATGPDGVSLSASTIIATSGNATCLQSITSASAQRTFSIWLKRLAGTGNIDLTVDNGSTWTTKTITSSWAKYSITQSAVTNPIFGIRIVTSADGVCFWGAQLESAAFASSTIPTTTTSVARTVDIATRVLSSEFSATAGSVAVVGTASGGQDAGAGQHVISFDDNTAAERMRFFRLLGSDTAEFRVADNNVTQAGLTGTFANNTLYRAAMAWAANDFAFSFNGAAVSTDASGTLPTVTRVHLGGYAGGADPGYCHIRKVDYWPTRLPNGFLTSV